MKTPFVYSASLVSFCTSCYVFISVSFLDFGVCKYFILKYKFQFKSCKMLNTRIFSEGIKDF